ncbi:membrane cofactor protein-like isoform X2 [Delphinus delphis]|uniref:membrane cofactor protein-like isoform X2 n=1 Tax=Delphinus delphis TaxID=9728 RepID=UPI0028C4E966|nr:membrane cofactor protein-like isoform X2 [Delphinus delphis]
MTASCAPRRAPCQAPPGRPESPPFPWCCGGILLLSLVLPLPIFSGPCIDPPVMESMKLKGVIKRHYYSGDRINYECRIGYFYVWPYRLSSTCEPNGSWSPIEEACLRKSCPNPEIKHGEVYAPNKTFEFESEAHISCNEGYYLRGKSILTCNRIGGNVHWSDKIPHCEKIFCGRPPEIKHGKHTNSYRNIFEYNELVTYSCNPSNGSDEYSLVGERQLICSGPGKWSSAAPLCKGYKPTHPTKTPLAKYPGYPNPSNEILSLDDFEDLDTGIIALIILTAIVAVVVVCTCLYRCLHSERKEEKDMKKKEKKEKKEKEKKENKNKEKEKRRR